MNKQFQVDKELQEKSKLLISRTDGPTSIEESVQQTMIKISEHIMKFMSDIAIDCGFNEYLSARICGDGNYYTIEVHNGLTDTRVGRIWSYKDVLDMFKDKEKTEVFFNEFVRDCETLTRSLPSREETHWL